ncbi:MAG TPA: hypothetical protein VHR97_02030 [Candidatus Baltobacteraceae bacterium]|nr:hypothetical protein [Candidatus Baltobacteraceae bacterium]
MAACAPLWAVAASPAPSPSPSAADPCTGPARLLATANRPTVGYSTCAVKKDTVVVELGYQNQQNGTSTDGSVQTQVPQNFLRLGVAKNFEIDVIGPNYFATRAYGPSGAAGGTSHGVTDSGLGFKYELPLQGRWTFAVDGLDLPPNGSPALTAGHTTYTANLDASYSLSPAMAAGTTIGIGSTGAPAMAGYARYGVTIPSFVVTAQIPNFYQFYAEYVYVSRIDAANGGRAFTDFGVQKLLGTRTEIDVEYGHAFTGIPALKFDYIGTGLVLQFW